MTRARALWLMTVVLLVASSLRLPNLESTPPGLHYDEAANAIIAADIGVRGERPVFIESYTGKEVLFFYAAGALMNAIQPAYFVLRLTAAFIGLLTIAAAYWLGREMLADRRVAVIAAALVAVSFWHLVFSRLGFRAISQPLLQALAVAALFRGLKHDDSAEFAWKWFALSGFFLGLTGYTYLAARVFPVPLLLALLPIALARDGRRRQFWLGMALTGIVALVILSPLILYFTENPGTFWVRIAQVSPGAEHPSVASSYMRSLGMFFLTGDPYWRFNIPGRPLFNWFWGGLLVVGWIVALLRWRRWWYSWQKAAVLLLALVPLLMILPTALATGEIVPSNLRAIGLIPFVFFLPALGLVTLVEQLADLVRRPGEPFTAFLRYLSFLEGYEVNYAFLVLLILLMQGVGTWRTYFEDWATRADLFYSSDADLMAVSSYLDEQAPPDIPLYVAALHDKHPTVAALSANYDRVRWLTNSEALALPEEGNALYIYPHNSPAPQWVQPYLDGAQHSEVPTGPDGEPLYEVYRLAATSDVEEGSFEASFGGVIEPLWLGTVEGRSGQQLQTTFAWRVLRKDDRPLRLFAQLFDIWGTRWGQAEVLSYAAEQWEVGDVVLQRIRLPIAPGTPPGNYRLHIGFFDERDGQRLPRLDNEGRYAGDALIFEEIPVAAGPPPQTQPEAPQGRPQSVRQGLELLGYTRGNDTVETGAHLPLALWWWATVEQPPMTLRLELIRGDDTGVILVNTRPVRETYPFQNWRTPLFLRDVIDPRIPVNLESGAYRLHLRLLDGAGATVFTSSLGTVEVQATERSFNPPPITHPLDVSFAGEIELLGYELEQVSPRSFRLQLVWRALQSMQNDYTVFVHLLRQDGTCCLWQSDLMPRQGQYPTSRWLEGEVVVDEYLIDAGAEAAAGEYGLELGLFIAETGQRLTLSAPGQETSDAVQLPPLVMP